MCYGSCSRGFDVNGNAPPTFLDEYEQLRSKVDDFVASVRDRNPAAVQCAPGCHGCCHDELSVTEVEAEAIRTAARDGRVEISPRIHDDGCTFLTATGRCGIYPVRPLVCRTQGLPIRYPTGWVPIEAVRWTQKGADVVACPLNYAEGESPKQAETLDGKQLDTLLGLVNQHFCSATNRDPTRRIPLASASVVGSGLGDGHGTLL